MINHNPYANTYIVAERSLLPVGGTRDVITIYADKDYKKFEQVREEGRRREECLLWLGC